MATFELQGPDGARYQVEAPDERAALAAIQKQLPAASAEPSVGMGSALLTGLKQGISANFSDELEGLKAAGGYMPSQLGTVGEAISGGARLGLEWLAGSDDASKRYEAARDAERVKQKEAEEQRPYSTLAGNVAGAIALPVGGALNAATLPGRMAAGAGAGAAYGGVSGLGGGEDLTGRLAGAATGAGLGAAAGTAAPLALRGMEAVGHGVGAIARPVAATFRAASDPEAEAARRVAGALDRDIRAGAGGLDAAEFAAARQAGVPVTMMEAGGDTTRALARSAANTSPEGRGVLERTISDRFETQSQRLGDWLRQNFHYPNANDLQAALDKAARSTNKSLYDIAYQQGSRGVLTPELERLASAPAVASALKAAGTTAKNQTVAGRNLPLVNNGAPTLAFWDSVKRNLDDQYSKLARAGEKNAAADIQALKSQLLQELDNAVPAYATARAGAAEFFGAKDALEAGQNFVTAKLGNREARSALAKMSTEERQLFQDGFVDRYVQTLNATGDRRNVLNKIANTPDAREKLEIVLGRAKAAELEAFLRVEGVMDLARTAIQGNSTTARQLAELGLAGGTYTIGTGGNVLDPNPTAVLNAALVYGAMKGRAKLDQRVARQVAEMLTSNDPNRLNAGLRILARQQGLLQSLRLFDAAVARGGAGQAAQADMRAIQGPMPARSEDERKGPDRRLYQ